MAGKSRATRMPMIAITTNSSTSVNAWVRSLRMVARTPGKHGVRSSAAGNISRACLLQSENLTRRSQTQTARGGSFILDGYASSAPQFGGNFDVNCLNEQCGSPAADRREYPLRQTAAGDRCPVLEQPRMIQDLHRYPPSPRNSPARR